MNKREIIDATQLATPCPANWADMDGDAKRRFCSECKLHVYNISEMSEEEAANLLLSDRGKDEGVCLRFFRRLDGTILTQNCPKGLQRLRERARQSAAWFAAGLSFLLSLGASAKSTEGADCEGIKPLFHGKINGQANNGSKGATAGSAATPTPAVQGHWLAGKPMMQVPTAEAVSKLEAQLHADEKAFGASDIKIGTQLVRLGNDYRLLGDKAKSRAALERALVIFEKNPAATRQQLKTALYSYQTHCNMFNDPAMSEKIALRLKEIEKSEAK